MAKFRINSKKSEPKLPDTLNVNREVRLGVDTANKNYLKLEFKDPAGISSVKVTAYKSNGKKINTYNISGTQCNSDKKITNTIQYKGYNTNTNMSSLLINKSYFINKSNKKDNKISFEIEATDTSGLTCKEKIFATYNKKGWETSRCARITSISYDKGYVYLTIKDNSGISVGNSQLQIIDKNNKNSDVVNLRSYALSAHLTDTQKKDNTIIEGTYKLDITKLKPDQNDKYKLRIKTTDSGGNTRTQNIILTASSNTNT